MISTFLNSFPDLTNHIIIPDFFITGYSFLVLYLFFFWRFWICIVCVLLQVIIVVLCTILALYMYTHPFYLERIKYFLPLCLPDWFCFYSIQYWESDESEQERKEGKMMVIIITASFSTLYRTHISVLVHWYPFNFTVWMNLNENFLSGDAVN